MSQPEFITTPQFDHAQAAKIGNRLELAGQGGWNDRSEFPDSITDEIDQAFRNVEQILALADATWDHVITVTSYHVGLDGHQDDINETMGTRFRHFMPNHAPTRTCLGVAALGDHRMRVEIVVTAILPG